MVDSESGVRSVQRALDLLACFDRHRPVWTVGELARASGLPKTTVTRLVATLDRAGMVWVRPDGQVAPGAGLLRWSRLAAPAWELPEPVRDVLRDVAEVCGETVTLWVRHGASQVCVAQEEGPRALRHLVPTGDALPLGSGAAAVVLLTAASDDLLAEVAARSPDAAELSGLVAAARRDGHAVSHGAGELGVSEVAAPVADDAGRLVAALALAGPTARFDAGPAARFAAVLTGSAGEIADLGLAPAFAPVERDVPTAG